MRKIKILIICLIACFSFIILASCNKNNALILDESDNNVGAITIENLVSNYIENPCTLESYDYLNGNLNYYIKYQFGKNAYYTFQKQRHPDFPDGFQIKTNSIYSRRENGFMYEFECVYLNKIFRDTDKFDSQSVDRKRSLVSGLLFEGCNKYLIEKGEKIYQVNPEKYTEYGTLAANSYGALGVQYITEDAKTLKIEIKKDNSVLLSYINMDNDRTEIKIYNFGKNYVTPLPLKNRIDLMIKNDESQCDWQMPE